MSQIFDLSKASRSSLATVATLFVLLSLAISSGSALPTRFDELPEDQKAATLSLLNDAMLETDADPISLIKLGIDRAKETRPQSIENLPDSSDMQIARANEGPSSTSPIEKQPTTTEASIHELPDHFDVEDDTPVHGAATATMPNLEEIAKELHHPVAETVDEPHSSPAHVDHPLPSKTETPFAARDLRTEPLDDEDKIEPTASNMMHSDNPMHPHAEDPSPVHHENPSPFQHENPSPIHHEDPSSAHHEDRSPVHDQDHSPVHHEDPSPVHHEDPSSAHHEDRSPVHHGDHEEKNTHSDKNAPPSPMSDDHIHEHSMPEEELFAPLMHSNTKEPHDHGIETHEKSPAVPQPEHDAHHDAREESLSPSHFDHDDVHRDEPESVKGTSPIFAHPEEQRVAEDAHLNNLPHQMETSNQKHHEPQEHHKDVHATPANPMHHEDVHATPANPMHHEDVHATPANPIHHEDVHTAPVNSNHPEHLGQHGEIPASPTDAFRQEPQVHPGDVHAASADPFHHDHEEHHDEVHTSNEASIDPFHKRHQEHHEEVHVSHDSSVGPIPDQAPLNRPHSEHHEEVLDDFKPVPMQQDHHLDVQPTLHEPTPISAPLDHTEVDSSSKIAEPVKSMEPTSDPHEEVVEDKYIDRSDPKDPKKVHIRKKNKSKRNRNGYSHERHESRTTTSLRNPKNYRHRESSSSSYSRNYNNGNYRNNWSYSHSGGSYPMMQPYPTMPSMPMMPPMPPMPHMPSMAMMPYAYHPSTAAWTGLYGPGYGSPQAYASAYAGAASNYYSDYQNHAAQNQAAQSKRNARRRRRRNQARRAKAQADKQ